jgi:hypothetical protein
MESRMPEPEERHDRPFRVGLGTAFALCFVSAFFGFWLVPEWLPWVRLTGAYFFYVLSVPVVLLVLVVLALWGGIGLLRARSRYAPAVSRHRVILLIGAAGIVCIAAAVGLERGISGGLPFGSRLQEFDPAIWKAPGSGEFISGDITPRQKMLGDVVANVLPGRGREELTALLGPSLDTTYFASTGRDMIYVLGPERTSLFAIDSEWLLIWLDESGRFERYEIAGD